MTRKTAKGAVRPPPLARVLEYAHPQLVARFCKDYGVSTRTANVVFKDLLRFLWLGAHAEYVHAPRAQMLTPMCIIDEMWHSFLSYSRDYERFSSDYFGRFLHHDPAPVHTGRSTAPLDSAGFVELVWKELGPVVARRWFASYGREYPMVEIRKCQLAAARGQ